MESYQVTQTRLREIDQECQAHLGRLEALMREIKRIRVALEDAQGEIAEVWASHLPRRNQLLLEQMIRIRCRQLEGVLRQLHEEAAAFAPPARLPYCARWWE
jgi:hypothetical protein